MFFKKKKKLAAFVTGKVVSLTEVKDEVFSTGMMGEG
ncbi:MAG: PTS glucose transporter subunit IIA, partial [Enterococcus sp.]